MTLYIIAFVLWPLDSSGHPVVPSGGSLQFSAFSTKEKCEDFITSKGEGISGGWSSMSRPVCVSAVVM